MKRRYDAATGAPESKLSVLRAHAERGEWREALRIAARFGDLGPQRDRILTGWGALQNPGFYRGMRRDPLVLVAGALGALVERYGLPAPAPGTAAALCGGPVVPGVRPLE